MMDKELRFVLRHYQEGLFDPHRAFLRVKEKTQPSAAKARRIPLWRRWAVAASVALVLLGGAFAALEFGLGTASQKAEQAAPATPTVRQFHYDHTPLSDVLRDLSLLYGINLKAAHTDKQLTADFEARLTGNAAEDEAELNEIIGMIEKVLNEKITKQDGKVEGK